MFASGEPLSRVVPLAIAAWTAAPTLALGGQTTPAPSMSLCSRKETRAPFRCHSLRSGWPLAKSWLRLRPHEGCPRLRLRGAEGLAPLFLTSALGCLKPYGFAAKNSRACGALCRPGGAPDTSAGRLRALRVAGHAWAWPTAAAWFSLHFNQAQPKNSRFLDADQLP